MERITAKIVLALLLSPSVCFGFGVFPMQMGSVAVSEEEHSQLYLDATVIYDFENDATDTKGAHNLTANNSPTYGTTTPPQGTHYATLDDATTQYFNVADHADLDFGGVDYTISFWVNLSSTSRGHIFSKGYTGDSYVKLYSEYNVDANYYTIKHLDVWAEYILLAIAPTITATWKHYVYSYESSSKQYTIYVDGVATAGSPYTMTHGLGNNAADLFIGRAAASSYMRGSIDEFVLWNGRTLNSTEASTVHGGDWR